MRWATGQEVVEVVAVGTNQTVDYIAAAGDADTAASILTLSEGTLAVVSNTRIRNTDHLPFDQVGLPAFQFIQDPIDFHTRTHHTNVDTYERLQPADLMHNATVVAWFVYLTCNHPELLPRKPLPRPVVASAAMQTPRAARGQV